MALILATLPLMPPLWASIRVGFGPPAIISLSALVALGGLWVLLRALAVRENRSPLRALTLAGCLLIFGYFLWLLENPVEEVHFLEYGLLGYLGFFCLRTTWGGLGIWGLRAGTLGLTAAVGLLDEGIQYWLPNRFWDIRDVGFNVLAGLLGLVVTELLQGAPAREKALERPR
ncbi:MAG: VanZ family protein [Nitrospinota bacterium]